jgi:hypothetical protein
MTSALSITRAVNPPRAAFLDFPLGHTTGKARDPALQKDILVSALAAFDEMTAPGSISSLPFRWSESDAWKDSAMRAGTSGTRDDRIERLAVPQYQSPNDRTLAESRPCSGCIWLESEEP